MGGYGGIIASTMAQTADNDLAHKQERKDLLSDEERRGKSEPIIAGTKQIQASLPALKDQYGEDSPQYKEAIQKLTDYQQSFDELYHPIKAPGAIAQDFHWIADKIRGITQPKTATSSTTQAPATTINTPAAPLQSPELPGGLSGEAGTPAATGPGMGGGLSITLPAGPQTTVTKAPPVPWGQAQLLKQQAAARQKAQQESGLLAAGVGLSQEQQAKVNATAANAGELARIQGQIKNYKTLNPDATNEDVSAYASSLMPGNNQIGNWEVREGDISGQPYPLSYDKKRGVYKLPDNTISSTPPENWKPVAKASGATAEELREYAEDNDPKKGPFPQWLASKRAQGSASAKPQNKDERYIAINEKRAQGQPVTDDDKAFLASYDLWTQKTKIDPGVARAAAFGAMRYIPVVSPEDPENVIMMRAGDAAKSGVNTPASIGFKTDQAITRYMTSGAGGTNINYFNTATDHLKLLAEAGEALNNGQTQLFNKIANNYATATGNPAPSNFETVKAAVAGELSKTFKGTGATDSEIADINQTINQAQSPQQIQGAITYYSRLMGSKVNALKSQYEAAKSGKPNFPGSTPPPIGNAASKGSRSLAAAMALEVNKGKSAAEVEQHLKQLGYTVTKP